MPTSTLEIYKLHLTRGFTFTSLANRKWVQDGGVQMSEHEAFMRIYEEILHELTQDNIWRSRKYEKKGLAIVNVQPQGGQANQNPENPVNNILSSHADNFVVEGYIDGGIYDVVRKMATSTQANENEEISRDKIITDSYYFYLYLRMNSSKGVLMLEKKKNTSMSGPLCEFVCQVLGMPRICRCREEMFLPYQTRQAFQDGAVIKSLTCSTDFVSSVEINGENIDDQYRVTVKVEPANRPSFADRQGIINKVKGMLFGDANHNVELEEFHQWRGEMFNEAQMQGKTFYIDEPDVVPKLELNDELWDEETCRLKREDIYAYCQYMLPSVQAEVFDVVPVQEANQVEEE